MLFQQISVEKWQGKVPVVEIMHVTMSSEDQTTCIGTALVIVHSMLLFGLLQAIMLAVGDTRHSQSQTTMLT